ncbi:phosphate regulon sensor histidine kinase PhoR [Piscinibacter gummiphilus]|uniref:Phosphate regulon sensor protein PhoR n=1 Tax=Piscinibacter gummiphilus TaxID=946333 RepID=A0A1W6LAX5_9BURK|nr:phosphate regulon sensor histidine kinase PhoR [Piscinibacter gummiphilus]ARN21318.1 PAS domain-containing sensor histidine kinase [Piscinibacter gummiphilus]ATU66004.1 phosphate regulon sensor histidine kinase PhoR [Piscinibacter gummiphilus]GLS96346.1 phosphate regulon sensor histidine kinase PhoR [Piscinibacter gummiphilus]
MTWLFPRFLASVLAMVVGGVIGYLSGDHVHAPLIGALLGGAVGVGVIALIDTIRGYRLIHWLAGSQEEAAPRDTGFWGEIGYRVERSIRSRERGTEQERVRLEQFLSAMEASPNGILLLDSNDQITWCNSVAADHFGLHPERDRLQPVTNLVRAPGFVAALQRPDTAEPITVNDLRARSTLSIAIRTYGEGLRLVLSQDVTQRERADAMRRDFVANVSHEIRSPLTVVAGFIETMGSLPLTEVERKRVLMLMGQQTQRMQTLVADLLTLAQLEGSPRPPSDRWVPLSKLLAQSQADATALSAGRHVLTFPSDCPVQVAGNEPELLSALTNIVNNAVRYTPEGGRITVTWRSRDDGSGEVAVTDTGIGVEREHIPRLTERFYRVDGSRSRDTGGTGLGLSIVKHVIQRHGGELEVTSEIGKGSRFALLLPAARVRVPAPRTQAGERAAA